MIVEGEPATPEAIGFSENTAVVEPGGWILLGDTNMIIICY